MIFQSEQIFLAEAYEHNDGLSLGCGCFFLFADLMAGFENGMSQAGA